MSIQDITLIIPNFNQLSYLKNLINQFRFYYPENPIAIIDNGSTYQPLLDWYASGDNHYEKDSYEAFEKDGIEIVRYYENDFVGNLSIFLKWRKYEAYLLSDPDISIPPTVPPNFLEIFYEAIRQGFHHAGFGLRTSDLPEWNPKSAWIAGDEKNLLQYPITITHEGKEYHGYKAPIDTTFALYSKHNGGWTAPMTGEAWSNSVRLFEAIHLTWYLHADYLNDEMKNYFATAKKRELGKPTAGQNHYQPFTGMH